MSSHAIDLRCRSARSGQRGSALVTSLVVMVGLAGLLSAVAMSSVIEIQETRLEVDQVRSGYVAQAGSEAAINMINQAAAAGPLTDPLSGVRALFATGDTVTAFSGTALQSGGAQVGAYSVRLVRLNETPTAITIAIDASGYMPVAPGGAGAEPTNWSSERTTVRLSMAPSEVFNYAYFLNNWGWLYGDSITAAGNARSNGQFDAANFRPTVTGQPMYDLVEDNGGSISLSGYKDDNGDGLFDGNDGGIYSGWDIVNVARVRGNGGQTRNQHDFDEQVDMPNLSNLGMYEQIALGRNATIRIGGVVQAAGVVGDAPGERQNLYLVGTAANPIVLNGPIVVRGDVIIHGHVTGQGAIFAGGNIYCPNSIQYVNGPSTPRPANTTQAATEAWLSTNWNRDFLGLFAKENIVVGDHTNSTWRHYVGGWMGHPMNSSVEDAGADKIPNTRNGRDGIRGTADDDVLEGDGVFTIQRYTAEHQALGLIPPGSAVGRPIPGTGEDIDGDGVFDPRKSLTDVTLTKPLNTTVWAGNMPSGGISQFRNIASMNAARFDAVFYTNQSFCWTVLGGVAAQINGALICRNENIVYGTPSLSFNHDARLLGGPAGKAADLLPRSLQPLEILRWMPLDNDPNRYLVQP